MDYNWLIPNFKRGTQINYLGMAGVAQVPAIAVTDEARRLTLYIECLLY